MNNLECAGLYKTAKLMTAAPCSYSTLVHYVLLCVSEFSKLSPKAGSVRGWSNEIPPGGSLTIPKMHYGRAGGPGTEIFSGQL